MRTTVKSNLIFTGKPSFGLPGHDIRSICAPAELFSAILKAGSTVQSSSVGLAYHLAELARQSVLLGERDSANAAGQAILELPLPSSVHSIGTYYTGLQGNSSTEELRTTLAKLADQTAPGLRERVVLQYARTYLNSGDIKSATYYYLEAARISAHVEALSHLQAHRLLAVCLSANGDHVGALNHLNRLRPSIENVRRIYPLEYYAYLNSLAVELGQLSRTAEAKGVISLPLSSSVSRRFPDWFETQRELDEIEAKGATAPPLIFAVGSVYEPAASQLEGESRAEVSTGTKQEPDPETVRAQAVPLAQPIPARSRAIATSYKREAIPLAAIPLVKLLVRRAPQLPTGTSENCSAERSRPRALHDYCRYIRSKPARAPPTGVLPIYQSPLP